MKDLEKLSIVSADDEGLTPEQVVKDFGLARRCDVSGRRALIVLVPDSSYTTLAFSKHGDAWLPSSGMSIMPGSDDYNQKVSPNYRELKNG